MSATIVRQGVVSARAQSFRAGTRVAMVLALWIGASGCSKSLTRERAAELLRSDANFSKAFNSEVALGKFWYDWRNVYAAYPYKPLSEQGLLTVKETGKVYAMWWKQYVVSLTPQGKDAAAAWSKTNERPSSFLGPQSTEAFIYLIPLASKELIGITGITSDPSEKAAGVEFDWKWAPTKQCPLLPQSCPPSDVHHGRASVQLYDDGWRISQAQI
jgi:hypothetical protein